MQTVRRDWTAHDLENMPDDGNRYETIDGKLFVSPSPSLQHQDAVGQMYLLLANYLKKERIGHAYVAPADVNFSARRVVQPDLLVVPLVHGRRPNAAKVVHNLLVAVEVLSPGSARADRVNKRALYRDEHVAQYWVVDLDARTIERSTPDESRAEVLAERLEWLSEGALTPLEINLCEYFGAILEE